MAEQAFPPRLFMIGAQKSGTTTLAHLLDQHPDIALSDPKEPGFFSSHFEQGLDWYRKCFPKALPPVLLDASTEYTMAAFHDGGNDTVVRRIKETVPEARFIYVIRDPADRTISSYWHDRRAGRLDEDLRTALEANPFYINVSMYYRQVEPYLKQFPRERFLFIDFRDLSADPVGVAERCVAFAGLDPNRGEIRFDEPRNRSFQFNRVGRLFYNMFPNERAASRFVGAAKSVMPRFLVKLAWAAMTKSTTETDSADRAWLVERFREENKRMEAICGFRFYR